MTSRLAGVVAWLLLSALGGCNRSDARTDEADAQPQAPLAPRVQAPVARVSTTDRWLDLVAQRPRAVVLRDGLVHLELFHPAATSHFALGERDRWRLPVAVDGRAAAVLGGRTATIHVPLDGDLAPALHPDTEERAGLAMALEVRGFGEGQSVTVLWNERPLAHLSLSDHWERRTLSLPGDLVRPGENELRLHFRRVAQWEGEPAAGAVQRVEVGGHAAITDARPDAVRPPAYRVEPRSDGEALLRLRAGTSLAYHLVPPRRGRLLVDVSGKGAFRVRASTDADHRAGKAPRVLLDEALRPAGDRRELDLTAWGGSPVRLELEARGTDEDSEAVLHSAQILVRRPVPRDARDRGPRDVIVLSVEGARADEVLEAGRRPSLDGVDDFLRESLVFERAYAVGAAAVPSHAAWMSSVVPPVHLTVRGTFVADAQVMLPEALGRAGVYRVLVSANDYVNEERGLLQGFDAARVLESATDDGDAQAVVSLVRELIEGHSDRWFALANVRDPQAPYEPPRELVAGVPVPAGAPLAHLTHVWVGRVHMGKHEPSEAELTYVRRLYRGELQVVDRALGDLVELLRERGRLEDAIVVLLGVHGEEFFEHGGAGHGRTLHEESIRVPLAIRAPKLLAPGRVTVPVDLLDLAPTIADLTGAKVPDGWQGESLVPVVDDPHPPPRLVIAYLGDGSRAAIIGDHKLTLGSGHGEQFYDLAADPQSQTDQLATGGVALRMVRTALAWQLAHEGRWKRARWGTGANLRAAFALDLGM